MQFNPVSSICRVLPRTSAFKSSCTLLSSLGHKSLYSSMTTPSSSPLRPSFDTAKRTLTTAGLQRVNDSTCGFQMTNHSPVRHTGRGNRRLSMVYNPDITQLGTSSTLTGNGRYVRIVEVSPRDGLQNLREPVVGTDVKRELVERLLDAGVRNIEVGSFVRGDRIPQMADTATLLPLLSRPPATSYPLPDRSSGSRSHFSGLPSTAQHSSVPLPDDANIIHYPVLVPNMRGLDNLLNLESQWKESRGSKSLTDEIAVFVAATEEFSQANNHASVEQVISALPSVIEKAKDNGYRVRGYVSCVVTCPYSGDSPIEKVVEFTARLLKYGCYEVSLGDTTGEGHPEAWRLLWDALESQKIPMDRIAAHCHDTFSMALSSILSLLPRGLRSVDSSLAGLGGCPYSPGATGNVPTEDVVYALHKLGYQTGIDLDKLVEAGNWLSETLGVRNESRVGRAIWARRLAKEEKDWKINDQLP